MEADRYMVTSANPPETDMLLEGPACTGPVGVPFVGVPPDSSVILKEAEPNPVYAGAMIDIELLELFDPPLATPNAPLELVLNCKV
jgi:hypothetical protein